MATFAIGDIHGCYNSLRLLLDKINFDPCHDTLWIVGDMINRGPSSLATLRFLKSLDKACIAILGNHDLHMLAVDAGIRKERKGDTLYEVLSASDKDELLHWVRHRPFLHHCKKKSITMVHAGIPPIWTLKQAKKHALRLKEALQSDHYHNVLKILFNTDSTIKYENMRGHFKKLYLAANYFTRMRFCDNEGTLELNNKSNKPNEGFFPWYSFKQAPMYKETILFGHWSALEGKTEYANIHALDTGCVWGNKLTAMDLRTFKRTSIKNKD